MNKNTLSQKKWTWLILLTSSGTLICCALPIIFVSLGMGAVVASVATSLPFLITLSLHKAWVFSGSAVLLCLGGWLLYRPGRTCPADPKLAEMCENAFTWNCRIYWLSIVIWCVGFFFAYIAESIFY